MDENKSKEILNHIFRDMEDFVQMKGLDYPPIYLLGGSGCIIAGYFDRATTDVDLIDMDYDAGFGRILRLLDRYDLLDLYLTTIPCDFAERALKINGYKNLYVLSIEDIILSKLGRYSEKDKEDISILIEKADKALLAKLIDKVLGRENISVRVKNEFIKNLMQFKESFNV